MTFQTQLTNQEQQAPYIVSTRLASALMGHQPPYEQTSAMELLHLYFQYFSGGDNCLPSVNHNEKKTLERFKKFHPMAIEFFSHSSHRVGGQVWRNEDGGLDRHFRCSAEVGQREFKLPISSNNPDHPGYLLLANYTLPLIDQRVSMIDPISTKSAKKVTAETYTLGWTSEVRFIQSRAYENQKRKLQNMEPLPPFKRQYKELPPFSGAMKVHIARDQANLEAIDSQPIPDYWVSQLHFVNAVQRNVLTNIGLPSEYENRLRIGLFSPSVDRGHLYCIPYNQMLEAELFKRLEVFFQCVNDGVSPSSPRIKKTFDYYHVDNIQKNLQILPKKIEAMAGQALNQMDLLDQQKIQLDEKKQGFQKVLDRIYSDYTQKTGDIVLLPGNRTLEQREPDGKVNVSLIAQALRRAVNLQESVERLYKMIQNQALDASVVISQLEDMLTTYELDRSLLEGVIENNFSQMAEMAESTEPPLVQVTKTKDSRIYNQLAARRDAIESEAKSHPTQ